jgi:chromate reductase
VLQNKPVAVMGASTGSFGGVWAQADLKRILGIAGARVVDAELAIPRAHERLAEEGRLIEDETQAAALIDALVGAVRLRDLAAA